MDVIVDRCAGLDVHKKTVMATVRTPDGAGGRAQHTREFATFTGRLVELRDWLVEHDVIQVAMEATGVYWKAVWHVLEDAGSLELLLVNPAHFKNLPGRKTDVKDSEWLAQLLECGLLRGSFIPPASIAKLRDLTRYRTKIVQERVLETQRIQKLLEDAGIKLDSVATDVLGKSCRNMLEALIAGERDPELLADMALTRMRPKIVTLREALVGRFDDHHAVLLRMHLDHVDELSAIEARLDSEVDRLMVPFAEAATRLLTIPGVGKRIAEVFIAKVNGREHRTTRSRPDEMLAEEQTRLHRLPEVAYTAAFGETRKVSWSSTISYGGVAYSVPHTLVDDQVWCASTATRSWPSTSPVGVSPKLRDIVARRRAAP